MVGIEYSYSYPLPEMKYTGDVTLHYDELLEGSYDRIDRLVCRFRVKGPGQTMGGKGI